MKQLFLILFLLSLFVGCAEKKSNREEKELDFLPPKFKISPNSFWNGDTLYFSLSSNYMESEQGWNGMMTFHSPKWKNAGWIQQGQFMNHSNFKLVCDSLIFFNADDSYFKFVNIFFDAKNDYDLWSQVTLPFHCSDSICSLDTTDMIWEIEQKFNDGSEKVLVHRGPWGSQK